MATTREDLNSFHDFVVGRLATGDTTAPLDELFIEWHDSRSREVIDDAIRRGLADLDAGRHAPADQVMDAIAKEFGLARE